MTYAYAITTTSHPEIMKADVCKMPGGRRATLNFGGTLHGACLHVPRHVAEHTAAAFNRAMQAVPDGTGWTYDTPSGKWHISRDSAMGTVYLCQHEDADGESPAWHFTTGTGVIDAMDSIDDLLSEYACGECDALVGEENLVDPSLVDPGDELHRCSACYLAWAKRQADMQEAADDDKAHAAQE